MEIIEQKLSLVLDDEEVSTLKIALQHLMNHKSTQDEEGQEIGTKWIKLCGDIYTQIINH